MSDARKARFVSIALSYAGCGVTSDEPRFRDLIAPKELDEDWLAKQMESMSGCGLVQLGLLRKSLAQTKKIFVRYVNASAISLLLSVFRDGDVSNIDEPPPESDGHAALLLWMDGLCYVDHLKLKAILEKRKMDLRWAPLPDAGEVPYVGGNDGTYEHVFAVTSRDAHAISGVEGGVTDALKHRQEVEKYGPSELTFDGYYWHRGGRRLNGFGRAWMLMPDEVAEDETENEGGESAPAASTPPKASAKKAKHEHSFPPSYDAKGRRFCECGFRDRAPRPKNETPPPPPDAESVDPDETLSGEKLAGLDSDPPADGAGTTDTLKG